MRAYEHESVCFHFNVLMGTHADMDMILEAIRKIYDHADELK
jgi:L-glutamine:2-deoxy-scyllo-inosose/3-amino-2,3-dideoxy-scyllo-inosose aminotransferase